VTRTGWFFLFLGIAILKLNAQDAQPDDKALQTFKNILKLDIEVSLIQQDQKIAWNTKGSKYTIPGKAVKITIEGNNIKMYGTFTPYSDADGNLILLAQGLIFISSQSGNELRYSNYFKIIYARMGETLVFFPLGVPDSNKSSDATNIEIDIQIQLLNQPLKENEK
jgi:hypothetical protein